jgi:hypothetical protein
MKSFIIVEGSVQEKMPVFQKGDLGTLITFHVMQDDGHAQDLTSKTVKFKAKRLDAIEEYIINSSCTVTVPLQGYCTIVMPELTREGVFEIALEVITGTPTVTQKVSIPLGFMSVRADV